MKISHEIRKDNNKISGENINTTLFLKQNFLTKHNKQLTV